MKTIMALALLSVSSVTMANTVLTCQSSGAGGALVKEVVVKKEANGLKVYIESYLGRGLNEVKVLKNASSSVSTKLILDANTGAKTSLVIDGKQAVVLYEAETGEVQNENGGNVEFLVCK